MVARFEEIFEEVMEELNLSWYALFDSKYFGIVESRITREFGEDVLESTEFEDWYEEMAMEL